MLPTIPRVPVVAVASVMTKISTPGTGFMRERLLAIVYLAAVVAAPLGCSKGKQYYFLKADDHRDYACVATQIEYPDADQPVPPPVAETLPPHTINDQGPPEYWPLRLEEAIQLALANSRVMRDLGGRVISSTQTITTV